MLFIVAPPCKVLIFLIVWKGSGEALLKAVLLYIVLIFLIVLLYLMTKEVI